MVAPAVVRLARQLWWCQWRQLMGGLGPADAEGNYRRPPSPLAELPPLPADAAAPGSHVLIVGRSCPWAHRAWLTWSLRGLAASIALEVVEPDPAAGRWRFPSPSKAAQPCSSSIAAALPSVGSAPPSRCFTAAFRADWCWARAPG